MKTDGEKWGKEGEQRMLGAGGEGGDKLRPKRGSLKEKAK